MFKGRRFTPAMIVAMIALAVALSGTAVAGTAKLITGSQIANGTIKLADIHPSAKTALKGEQRRDWRAGACRRPGCPGPGRAAGRHRREGRHGCDRRSRQGRQGRPLRAGHAPLRLHQGRQLPRRGLGRHRHRGMRRRPGCQPDQGRDRRWRAVPQRRPQHGHAQNSYVGETHITDSFPGRMYWDTNTPKPNRLDGWIVLGSTPPRLRRGLTVPSIGLEGRGCITRPFCRTGRLAANDRAEGLGQALP